MKKIILLVIASFACLLFLANVFKPYIAQRNPVSVTHANSAEIDPADFVQRGPAYQPLPAKKNAKSKKEKKKRH